MTKVIQLAAVALLATAPLAAGHASPVTVDFSGTVSLPGLGYTVGTAYSGEFTYDTTAAFLSGGINFAFYQLAPGAFTVNIGADTLTNTGSGNNIEVINLGGVGDLLIGGFTMTGTGPLNGSGVFPEFFGSSDPSFAALTLPSQFPTDFTTTSLNYFVNNVDSFGSIRNYAQANPVPEPLGISLFATGLAALVLTRRKNAGKPRSARQRGARLT